MTDIQLKEIEDFAYGLMSPEEICLIMDIDIEKHGKDFSNVQTDIGKAFNKGLLKLKFNLNLKNIKFAEQSSSHAMNKVLKVLDKILLDIKKNENF